MIDEVAATLALATLILGSLFLAIAGGMILRCRKRKQLEAAMALRPEPALNMYDDFAPGEAVILAWLAPGDFPRYHSKMQDEVRTNMPILARALDRMVKN